MELKTLGLKESSLIDMSAEIAALDQCRNRMEKLTADIGEQKRLILSVDPPDVLQRKVDSAEVRLKSKYTTFVHVILQCLSMQVSKSFYQP